MKPVETIGKRIARLRQQQGWTQQALAARLALSRVAVSHIEMDLIVPSERTVTLLAGLFKLSPHELTNDTTYPLAKAERLPGVVCAYTALEVDVLLLRKDLEWLMRLPADVAWREREAVHQHWSARLAEWGARYLDERERGLLEAARQELAQWSGGSAGKP